VLNLAAFKMDVTQIQLTTPGRPPRPA